MADGNTAASPSDSPADPNAGSPMDSVTDFISFWSEHGIDMVIALFWLMIGVVIMQQGGRWLRKKLSQWNASPSLTSNLMLAWWIFCGLIIAWNLLRDLGFDHAFVRRLILAAVLFFVAAMMLIRPYIPKLPFRVGNLIKSGDNVGKVVDISLLNTRLKTFDGLTIVVPNASILNSTLINYHTLPNRRIKVDLSIGYSQDILQAKRMLEAEMISDPRVLVTPRPVVYVTRLDHAGVHLGGRCWVKNPKAWATRCDILEKLKYKFDRVGVPFAFPRHEIVGADDALIEQFMSNDDAAMPAERGEA